MGSKKIEANFSYSRCTEANEPKMSSVLLYEARFSQKMGVQSAHINMGPEHPKFFLSRKMKLSNVLINVGQGNFFCYIISLPNMHLQLLGLLWSTLYVSKSMAIKIK